MQEIKQLSGMTWDHPRAYDSLVAASKLYEQETGVSILWHKRSLQAFADVAIKDLTEEFDLIVLDHPHVGQIAESQCLVPLMSRENSLEHSLGGSAESYLWQEQLWAYPIDASCQMGVTRMDVDIHFPQYWEQLTTAKKGHYNLLTPLLPVDAFDTFLTLVASSDEPSIPFSDNEFCSETSGLQALNVLKCLFRMGPSEAVNWNPINVLEILSENREFTGSPCLFAYINYAQPDFRENQLLYQDLPVYQNIGRRSSILGGAGIGVSARNKIPKDALKFARWVTSEPIQSGVYLENSGQPAHLQSWQRKREDPQYCGFLSGGFNTMNTAWTRPRDEWFLHFVDDVCEIITDFFLRDIDNATFLKQINTLYRHHKS